MSLLAESPTDASSPLLAVEDLTTHIESGRGRVHAVDGVSFSLSRGGTLGIVGESGSGKSMLLKSILNLLPSNAHTAGSVNFAGSDLQTLESDELRSVLGNEIAIVLQDPAGSLNPVLRIEKQITESLRYHRGVSKSQARQIGLDLLKSVRIPDPERRLRQYPGELSGGMQQRVAIAAALACDPKLLLADEVTSSLDVTIGARILGLLATEQRRRDMAIILVTHDFQVVARIADHVMVMYGGKVVEMGPAETILNRPKHPYTAALLDCVPGWDEPSHTRRTTIPGQPVNLVNPPKGCRFAPRCQFAQDKCRSQEPPLEAGESPDHAFACFFPEGSGVESSKPGQLMGGRSDG